MPLNVSHTLLLAEMLVLCALPMLGQTADTGAIAGTVSDPSGALVPRAAVVINSEGTGEKRDLATDAEGTFSIQFLPPGKYDLTVRAAGFEPFILNGVQVQITEVSRLKIQLALNGAREQIAVSAAPSLLQTENATLGRVIDRNTIEELPLVNRNFTEILGLTAGTNTNIVDATQLGAGSQEIRANGAATTISCSTAWMRTVTAPISLRSVLLAEAGSRSPLRILFRSSRCRLRSTTRSMGEEQVRT
jgi:hypothetical protein